MHFLNSHKLVEQIESFDCYSHSTVPLSVICEKSRLKWLQITISLCQKTKFRVEEDFGMLLLGNKTVNALKSLILKMHINYIWGLFWPAGKRGNISQVICLAHNSSCHSNYWLFFMLLTHYSFNRPSSKSGIISDVTFNVIKFFLKNEW